MAYEVKITNGESTVTEIFYKKISAVQYYIDNVLYCDKIEMTAINLKTLKKASFNLQ